MKPGREIDALVAEHVMGWRKERGCAWWLHSDDTAKSQLIDTWSPSTDIAAAWEVVEKLCDQGFDVDIANVFREGAFSFVVEFEKDDTEGAAIADTAPMAICLAALDVMGLAQ